MLLMIPESISPAYTSSLDSYCLLDISTWMSNRYFIPHMNSFFPNPVLITPFNSQFMSSPAPGCFNQKTWSLLESSFTLGNLSRNHMGFTFKTYPKYDHCSLFPLLVYPGPSSIISCLDYFNSLLIGFLWPIFNIDTSMIPFKYDSRSAQNPAMVSPFHLFFFFGFKIKVIASTQSPVSLVPVTRILLAFSPLLTQLQPHYLPWST